MAVERRVFDVWVTSKVCAGVCRCVPVCADWVRGSTLMGIYLEADNKHWPFRRLLLFFWIAVDIPGYTDMSTIDQDKRRIEHFVDAVANVLDNAEQLVNTDLCEDSFDACMCRVLQALDQLTQQRDKLLNDEAALKERQHKLLTEKAALTAALGEMTLYKPSFDVSQTFPVNPPPPSLLPVRLSIFR